LAAKIAFAGTPAFAVPTLRSLQAFGAQITVVLTQPDRPAGRGRRMLASPVKQAAEGLHIAQPERLRRPAQLEAFGPRPELLVVVAYGLILPAWLLEWPQLGAVNVHASLLPRWRGAAPIQRAILEGDAMTGVSIMQMDSGLDTGPVYAMAEVAIGARTTVTQLHDTLAELGAQTLIEQLPGILSGTARPQPQNDARACYAPKVQKSEAQIDWHEPAAAIDRQIRALTGWPVAESTLTDGRRLRIWAASCEPDLAGSDLQPPGTILAADNRGIVVATGHGGIRITQLQPPGGRVMDAWAWLAAHPLAGARFVTQAH
jgi:methionyl-tRNA formyltransferase